MTTESTIDQPAITDHDGQLQAMTDAYERPILKALEATDATADTTDHVIRLVRQAIGQAFDAGHVCAPGQQPAVTADPALTATAWQDCPGNHTTAASIAAKLRLIARALEALGDDQIAEVWPQLVIQVTGTQNPAARKAAVDTIASALGFAEQAQHGAGHNLYRTGDVHGVSVYTASVEMCCEHCPAGGVTHGQG